MRNHTRGQGRARPQGRTKRPARPPEPHTLGPTGGNWLPTKTAPRIDASIAKAVPFATSILQKLRMAFPKGLPHGDGGPEVTYALLQEGRPEQRAGRAQDPRAPHALAGSRLDDPQGLFEGLGKTTMASVKTTTAEDLPPQAVLRTYVDWIIEAKRENSKRSVRTRSEAQELEVRGLLATSRVAAFESSRVQSSPVEFSATGASATGDGWVRTGSLPPRP